MKYGTVWYILTFDNSTVILLCNGIFYRYPIFSFFMEINPITVLAFYYLLGYFVAVVFT